MTISLEEKKANQAAQVLGNFYDYSSQMELPEITGTRIVKCQYKSSKGKEARQAQYVRIPDYISEDTVADNIGELMPYIVNWLQDSEDSMIKVDHAKGLTQVYVDGLGVEKIMTFLEISGSGNRLNGDKIAAWFSADLEGLIKSKLFERLGINPNQENVSETDKQKVELITQSYLDKLVSLASPKTTMSEANCEVLIKLIEDSYENSDVISVVASNLLRRLNGILQEAKDTLIAL
jgi:hypothetical protein